MHKYLLYPIGLKLSGYFTITQYPIFGHSNHSLPTFLMHSQISLVGSSFMLSLQIQNKLPLILVCILQPLVKLKTTKKNTYFDEISSDKIQKITKNKKIS